MNVEVAYTAKEIAQALNISKRRANEMAREQKWPSEKRQGRGGGKVYPCSGLPEEIQTALHLHTAPSTPSDALALVGKCAGGRLPAVRGADLVVPDAAHRAGLDRFNVVRAFLDERARLSKKGIGKTEAVHVFLTAYNSGTLLPGEFERLGRVSQPTLYRWAKILKENSNNYLALCDRRGAWVEGGGASGPSLGAECEQAFLNCWLMPNRPSITLAHRAMQAVLARQGYQGPAPSYWTTYRFAKHFEAWHNDLVVLKREGEKALKDKVGPYILRDPSILNVGDVAFCDGHVMNLQCLHPFTGRPFRPTLISWFDWRSRYPVGWEILPTENTLGISVALRRAIITLGKCPVVAYIDNGKAFKAKYFTDDHQEIEDLNGLYARLGINLQFTKPYEARTKIVERFWLTWNEQAARLLPTYTGNSIDDKPAHMNRNERYHKTRHDAQHQGKIPTIDELSWAFNAYVNWYAQQPHSGMAGETPMAVLDSGRGDGVDLDELNHQFLWSVERTPDRTGFSLAGLRYESDALYGLKMKILVKYSLADLSTAYLYTLDGTYIGEAQPVRMLNPLAKHFGDDQDMADVSDACKRQGSLKKATLDKARELTGVQGEGVKALPYIQGMKPDLQVVEGTPSPRQGGKQMEGHGAPRTYREPEPEVTPEEAERLTAFLEKCKRDLAAAPKYQAPAYFRHELERYDFLFGVSERDGIELTPEDAAFMAEFEAGPDWSENRYGTLRMIYQRQREKENAKQQEAMG